MARPEGGEEPDQESANIGGVVRWHENIPQARRAASKTLRSGKKVKSRKQAIAVGQSEARRKGKKVSKRKAKR
jgi:hypothetical protein